MEFNFEHFRDYEERIKRHFEAHVRHIDAFIVAGFAAINRRIEVLIEGEVKIMAELDDLKVSAQAVSDAVKQAAADMEAAASKLGTPGIAPADVEAVATALGASATSLKQASSDLEAALSPAPAPSAPPAPPAPPTP